MRLPFPSRARLKASTAKPPSSRTSPALPDIVWTSLLALKESADAFPPLKSAVGGVIEICKIAERTKHSKSEACDIALRTKEILDLVADAVPDPSHIPAPMLQSIKRFTSILGDIRCRMKEIALSSWRSRLVNLNRNERALQGLKSRLDDTHRDFQTASALRLELAQTKLAAQQVRTQREIETIIKDGLLPQISRALFYSKLNVFFCLPPK
ncbi:hypothetical protein DFH07DRAFT_970347 [Mycena maculata]|uniref:Uncharacterized protein n=1 Tax=Mycena maculata TaxID=230809 RepID=A0AAD7HRR3_9AGAR|nr:hypothetical protein DFH07DRAFT_970347 [Mycena maculata]